MIRVLAALSCAGALLIGGHATAAVFAYTGQISSFTADATGTYQIDAWGAQGGTYAEQIGATGGLGARVGGSIYLEAGDTLNIVVGGVGTGGGNLGMGGGGASWVYLSSNLDLLLAAGGGGGAAWNCCAGGPGLAGLDGGGTDAGTAGSGGGALSGGGGAGWLEAGDEGWLTNYPYGTGGSAAPSFQGGRTIGCASQYECYDSLTGGFGGGGGAGWAGGGGGGGYSGGGGGYYSFLSGGGGSFIAERFSNPVAETGVRSGSGLVAINLIAAVPEPSTWAMLLLGIGGVGSLLRCRRRRTAAALCAAASLCAGQAAADIVRFDAAGRFRVIEGPAGWYGGPLPGCPFGAPCLVTNGSAGPGRDRVDFNGASGGSPTYSLDFTFDTALGQLADSASLAEFSWSAADGPSPLLAGRFSLPLVGVDVDVTSATTLTLRDFDTGLMSLRFVGAGYSLDLFFSTTGPEPNLTRSETLLNGPNSASSFIAGDFGGSQSSTHTFTITNLGPSIPEPSTWGLLLLGFGALGALLRRIRASEAAAARRYLAQAGRG